MKFSRLFAYLTLTLVLASLGGYIAADVYYTGNISSVPPAADDVMLISNGSSFQNKSIPDCTDTGGNHLNYTASSNSMSCGTSGGAGGGTGTTYTPTLTLGTNLN